MPTPTAARLLALALATSLPAAASAVPLLTGFGGPSGYGPPEHCVAAGNDNSYAAAGSAEPTPIDLAPAFPRGLHYYERTVTRFFLNTNGNVTFAAPLAAPTATPFPIADQPMIAPWWADVDTRGGGSVCFHLEPDRLVATWHDVGHFDGHADRRNDFQMILSARPLCDLPGNFDVEFRYNRCEWASGEGAFAPAQVGLDGGNRRNYLQLPQSRTPAIVDLCRTSNVRGGAPGLFRFQTRVTVTIGCPGGGQPCAIPGQRGACATGVVHCSDGAGPRCVPLIVPRARGCDGLDNDCDGAPDEGDALCGAGRTCDRARARCLDRCGASGQCPAGMDCTVNGGCIERACLDVPCPPGQRCAGGRCVDLCETVGCARGQRCERGRCIDACERIACPALTVCDADPDSPATGPCVPHCECSPCREGRVCGPDGRCTTRPPLDGGVATDLGADPDAALTPEVATDPALAPDTPDATATTDAPAGGAHGDATPRPGRLLDAGCGCRAGSAPPGHPALSALALAAGIFLRRRRRPVTPRVTRDPSAPPPPA